MRAVELFAGAGGAALGLRDAGIHAVRCIELDESAAKTATQAGFPMVCGDVRDPHHYEDLGPVDLLWSSFPCQGWSTAGKRKGATDARNGWPWTLDAIDHLRAHGALDGREDVAWFLAENVTGLLQHKGAHCGSKSRPVGWRSSTATLLDGSPWPVYLDGRFCCLDPQRCPNAYFFGVILPQLRERFAWVDHRVLDAADYGAPQRRRRVIIAAGPRALTWPTPTHSGEALAMAKWETGSYWREVGIDQVGTPSAQESRWLHYHRQQGLFRPDPRAIPPWRTVRQALGLGGTLRVLGGGRNPNEPGDVRSVRDLTDGPSTTIAAQIGGGAWDAGPFVELHPEHLDRPALWFGTGRRRLTIDECAILQGFPPGYPWTGTKTSIYRQIGNAVPPKLAEVVARVIVEADRE